MTVIEIPKQAKAVVYDNPGTVSTKVTMVDVPEPGPGEVLVNLYVSYHHLGNSGMTDYLQNPLRRVPFGSGDNDQHSQ